MTPMDPQTQAYVRLLLASRTPVSIARAKAIQDQYSKPAELKPVVVGDNLVAFNPATGAHDVTKLDKPPTAVEITDAMMKDPAKYGFTGPDDPALKEAVRQRLSGQSTSVAINNVQHPVLQGVGEQIVAQRKAAQGAAYDTIPQIHDARRALDAGAITGAFAEPRSFMQKTAGLLGIPTDAASNTEVFRAAVGNQVLGHIKALGANPSNADRDYIEKVMGGQIGLEEKSLRRMLDMTEKYARNTIRNFNRDAQKLASASPDAYRGIAPLMQFDEPPEYAAPAAPAAAPTGGGGPSIVSPAAASGVRKYNPATGRIE
jgi:hypothetical protein